MLRCIDTLQPGLDARRKKRVANRILTLCGGKDWNRRISPAQAHFLIAPHLQCIQQNCALLCFWEPLARSLNMFFEEE